MRGRRASAEPKPESSPSREEEDRYLDLVERAKADGDDPTLPELAEQDAEDAGE